MNWMTMIYKDSSNPLLNLGSACIPITDGIKVIVLSQSEFVELQNYERCEHVHGCEIQGAKRSPDTLSLHNGNGSRKKVGVLAYKPVLYRSYICVVTTRVPLAQSTPMLRMLFYLYIGRTDPVGRVQCHRQVGSTRPYSFTAASGRMCRRLRVTPERP